jgi:uncharacterized protein YbjQ (UPF0145 family)
MKTTVITCNHIGVCMNETKIEEKTNADGNVYFKATAKIGSIFGSEVEGECTGIGETKEQALKRLEQDIENLSESLWI